MTCGLRSSVWWLRNLLRCNQYYDAEVPRARSHVMVRQSWCARADNPVRHCVGVEGNQS
jgi:hypothetical protein